MAETRWWTYVRKISNNSTPAKIARDTGLDKSAPSRWSRGGGVEASQAVGVARAYSANVLEALVASGYIEADEVHLTEVQAGLSTFTPLQLLRELTDRAVVEYGEPPNTVQLDIMETLTRAESDSRAVGESPTPPSRAHSSEGPDAGPQPLSVEADGPDDA